MEILKRNVSRVGVLTVCQGALFNTNTLKVKNLLIIIVDASFDNFFLFQRNIELHNLEEKLVQI